MDYGGLPSHRAKGPASPATTHTPRSPAVNRSVLHVSGTGSSLTLSSGASISYLSSYGCSGACKCMNNLLCTTTSTIFGMADHSSTPGNGAGRSYPPYGIDAQYVQSGPRLLLQQQWRPSCHNPVVIKQLLLGSFEQPSVDDRWKSQVSRQEQWRTMLQLRDVLRHVHTR